MAVYPSMQKGWVELSKLLLTVGENVPPCRLTEGGKLLFAHVSIPGVS